MELINVAKWLLGAFIFLASLVAAVLYFIKLWKHIFKTSIKVEFDDKNVHVCPINSDNKNVDGKSCFVFFAMHLIGKGEKASTVQEVELFLKENRFFFSEWLKGNRIRILTYNIVDKTGQHANNCAIISNGIDQVIYMDFNNFGRGDSGPLEYGKTYRTDTVFCFDLSIDEIKKYKFMKIEIKDYFNKIYRYKFKIKDSYFKNIHKKFKLVDMQKLDNKLIQSMASCGDSVKSVNQRV